MNTSKTTFQMSASQSVAVLAGGFVLGMAYLVVTELLPLLEVVR